MSAQVDARARRAVFLDRDGVLNALVERDGVWTSPRRPGDFRLSPGAADAVRRMRAGGRLIFVVTNQPDVARGRLAASDLEAMHALLRRAVQVDEVAVCPHDDADACACRKPKPGLLLDLAARWGVDVPRSFIVGDSWKDVEAGRRAGCRTILLGAGGGGEGHRDVIPDHAVATLDDAAAIIAREREFAAP